MHSAYYHIVTMCMGARVGISLSLSLSLSLSNTLSVFRQLCALALLGVAVWLRVDKDIKNIDDDIPVDDASLDLLRVAAIMLIAFGALLFLISLLGVIGAIMEHRIILGIVRTGRLRFSKPLDLHTKYSGGARGFAARSKVPWYRPSNLHHPSLVH